MSLAKRLARQQRLAKRGAAIDEMRGRKRVHDRIWGANTQAPDPLLGSLRVKLCRRLVELAEQMAHRRLDPVGLFNAVEAWSQSTQSQSIPPPKLLDWWHDLQAHNQAEKAKDYRGAWGKPLCSEHAGLVAGSTRRVGDPGECGICGRAAQHFATHEQLQASEGALQKHRLGIDPIERVRQERRART